MISKTRYLRIWLAGVLASLLLSSPVSLSLANSNDWVRVERFKSQLKDAEAGNGKAMYEVGYMYERGRGVEVNLSEAHRWYQKAAENGSQLGQARLGLMYFYGRGVAENPERAYEILHKAATAKVPLAQFYLGKMYETGRGVQQDYRKALQWYTASAKNGYYDPQGRIAAVKKELQKAQYGDFPKARQAAPKTSSKLKLAKSLLQTVMKGDWQRAGKPASYLPSSNTNCKQAEKQKIRCQSSPITRNSGGNIITYVTVATLSEFNQSQQFRVVYHNNILQIHPEGEKPKYDDEEEFSAANLSQAGNIHLGRQKTQHSLNCAYEKAQQDSAGDGKLVCIKDRVRTLEFMNKKS